MEQIQSFSYFISVSARRTRGDTDQEALLHRKQSKKAQSSQGENIKDLFDLKNRKIRWRT